MNFDFTGEQCALRDVVRELFARESPPERLRGERASIWKRLAEVGITGLTVPERYGGSGGDEVDLQLVAEEAGRSCLPEPLVECLAVAVPALVGAGTDVQRDRWLPAIAAGEALATVACGPFVLDADVADLVIVALPDGLHAVPRERVRTTAVASSDPSRRLFEVEADIDDDTRMDGGLPAAAMAWRRGAAGTAAVLNGVSMRLVEMTLDHVREREQFGRPVGAFQAVKHKLATMHTLVSSARPASWYAAYALGREPDRGRLAAAVAKERASVAAAVVNREALQCHGGIGFTWEHDLHLWLKRGKALEAAFGTAADHRTTIAEETIDVEDPARPARDA
jgi:alkylation response protein AidB-like acyl-CoA dehydrogenase